MNATTEPQPEPNTVHVKIIGWIGSKEFEIGSGDLDEHNWKRALSAALRETADGMEARLIADRKHGEVS